MAKYLVSGSYTREGAQGLLKKGGTSRRATIKQLAKSMGGTIDAFYFAFGDDDVSVICDLPDQASMTALALAVGASGALSLKTTVLITPEEVDAAARKTVSYRAPGQ